jgi:hypothetical protein
MGITDLAIVLGRGTMCIDGQTPQQFVFFEKKINPRDHYIGTYV